MTIYTNKIYAYKSNKLTIYRIFKRGMRYHINKSYTINIKAFSESYLHYSISKSNDIIMISSNTEIIFYEIQN
jgi:hypothetical protein